MAAREDGLTPRQRKFVSTYMSKRGAFNATRTVLALGFTENEDSARVIGAGLLADLNVKAAIRLATEQIITPSELIQRQADLVRMSIAPAVEVLGPGQVRINYEKAEEAGLLEHAENVDYNARGQAVVRFPTQEAKNRAAALLGKWLQMEAPKPASTETTPILVVGGPETAQVDDE